MGNSIHYGSSIPIPVSIDEKAEKYFNMKPPTKILLVEGKTDRIAIENYYYFSSRKRSFSIRTTSMESEENSIDGKKNVLTYYFDNMNTVNKELRVLIDKDYDFHLGINQTDSGIFYYDYFELENYLFDEEIFQKFLVCSTNTPDRDISSILDKVNEFEVCSNFSYFFYLDVYRELIYHSKASIKLNNPEIYAEFCKKIKLAGIINGDVPGAEGESIDQRIFNYLSKELQSFYNNLFTNIIIDVESLGYLPQNLLDFFQHFYKGRKLTNCINLILSNVTNNRISFTGNIINMLLKVWLPESQIFNSKMVQIENSFNKQTS